MPKHRRTILREAAQKLLSVDRDDFLDAMTVLEDIQTIALVRLSGRQDLEEMAVASGSSASAPLGSTE